MVVFLIGLAELVGGAFQGSCNGTKMCLPTYCTNRGEELVEVITGKQDGILHIPDKMDTPAKEGCSDAKKSNVPTADREKDQCPSEKYADWKEGDDKKTDKPWCEPDVLTPIPPCIEFQKSRSESDMHIESPIGDTNAIGTREYLYALSNNCKIIFTFSPTDLNIKECTGNNCDNKIPEWQTGYEYSTNPIQHTFNEATYSIAIVKRKPVVILSLNNFIRIIGLDINATIEKRDEIQPNQLKELLDILHERNISDYKFYLKRMISSSSFAMDGRKVEITFDYSAQTGTLKVDRQLFEVSVDEDEIILSNCVVVSVFPRSSLSLSVNGLKLPIRLIVPVKFEESEDVVLEETYARHSLPSSNSAINVPSTRNQHSYISFEP